MEHEHGRQSRPPFLINVINPLDQVTREGPPVELINLSLARRNEPTQHFVQRFGWLVLACARASRLAN